MKFAVMQKTDIQSGRKSVAHLWDEKTDTALCGRNMNKYECVEVFEGDHVPAFITDIHTAYIVYYVFCKKCLTRANAPTGAGVAAESE